MLPLLEDREAFPFSPIQATQPLLYVLGDFLVVAAHCEPLVRTKVQVSGLLPCGPSQQRDLAASNSYPRYDPLTIRSLCNPHLVDYYAMSGGPVSSIAEYLYVAQFPTPCEPLHSRQQHPCVNIGHSFFHNTGTTTRSLDGIVALMGNLRRESSERGFRDLVPLGSDPLVPTTSHLCIDSGRHHLPGPTMSFHYFAPRAGQATGSIRAIYPASVQPVSVHPSQAHSSLPSHEQSELDSRKDSRHSSQPYSKSVPELKLKSLQTYTRIPVESDGTPSCDSSIGMLSASSLAQHSHAQSETSSMLRQAQETLLHAQQMNLLKFLEEIVFVAG